MKKIIPAPKGNVNQEHESDMAAKLNKWIQTFRRILCYIRSMPATCVDHSCGRPQ